MKRFWNFIFRPPKWRQDFIEFFRRVDEANERDRMALDDDYRMRQLAMKPPAAVPEPFPHEREGKC